MPADPRLKRFVTALIRSGGGQVDDAGGGLVEMAGRPVRLLPSELRALAGDGIIDISGLAITARPEARSWLRRASEADPEAAFVGQHRLLEARPEGGALNIDESPLARLARPSASQSAFLLPHHVAAGERIRRLGERASLQPRLTMSYEQSRVAGRNGGGGAAEVGDMAATARRDLARLLSALPADCGGVLLDVCVWLKGLQVIEAERGWPRRSAKLVLRIGLEQAARHFGLSEAATGADTKRPRVWRPDDARPTEFG